MAVFFSKADPKRDGSALVPKLWDLWTDITRSNYVEGPPKRFTRAVEKALEGGYSHMDLTNAIHYAAYLKPTTIKSDVTRVAKTIEDFDELDRLRALAIQLTVQDIPLDEYMGGGIRRHPDAEDEEVVSREEIMESTFSPIPNHSEEVELLAGTLGVSRRFWTEYEFAFALSILGKNLPRQELKDAIAQTRKDIGQYGVLPSDLVRTLSGVEFSRDIEVHEEEEEEEPLDASHLQLDERVYGLLQTGEFYYDHLLEIHHDVPEGYWGRISEEVEDFPSLSLNDIYNRVQPDFNGFHPDNREGIAVGDLDE
mgnify:FL=1